MVPLWWMIIALVGGVAAGWFMCALCVVNREADEAPERSPH